jgi:serine/threonine protein kinase
MTAEFTTGQHIGDYEILSILGMGGMGKVYKVRNVICDRIEAMKILLPDLTSNQGLADRFLREIRLLGTLNHPNIAALRTALTYENQLVMIMEFVEGETLANRIARAPISTAAAVNFSDQILSALSYAHKQNIIHRDIKPANMMLTSAEVVKLMDFGIARSSSDHALTNTGTTIGSLNYMPPEQVRGEAADARSDIYSYGVSLYELLTGQLPFKGDSHYSLMTAHLKESPAAPITLRSDLPPALNEIIMIAMSKDPVERFQSADAFRTALKSVPVSVLPSSNTTMTTGASKSPSISAAETIVDPLPARSTSGATLVEPSATPARVPTVGIPVQTPAPGMAASASPKVAAAASIPAGMTMPAAAVARSGRGLWIALGAILGVGVLIAAGIYIPRKTHTHADPSQSAFPSSAGSSGTVQPAQQGTPPTNTPAPPDASAGGTQPNGPANGGAPPSGTDTSALGEASGSSNLGPGAAGPGSGKESTNGGGRTARGGNGGNPKPWRGGQGNTNAQNGAANAQATPTAPPGPSPEELAKLDDEADKLNVRVSTVSQSVETLRKQQMASGYNLRADIAGSAERMQLYVAKGNAALKAQDTTNARKYFDLADAEISKVEKFLGH